VFVRSGYVPNCVNVARHTPARARLVVRHYDKVGVLANVLGLIREAGINVEAVQNTIFEQAQAASCAIELDDAPPPALIERIRSRTDEVLFVDAFDL
jgi:D-3-phosphoglycerate dehydrogenase